MIRQFFQMIRTYWFSLTLLMVAIVTFVSLRPLNIDFLPSNSDKTAHFIVYAVLALPVCLRMPKYLLVVLCLLALWSGLIELIQPFVGRYGEWADLIANISGLFIGFLLARLLAKLFDDPDKHA